jgi:hypothetical protein
MVYVLAGVFLPDIYLGHESMGRHKSMTIRHISAIRLHPQTRQELTFINAGFMKKYITLL